MIKTNTFKKFLATGKMPEETDALDEAIAKFEKTAEDGVLGRIGNAVKSGIGAAKNSWKREKSLEEHDKQFHPGGYKEGDTCKYRDELVKKDKADSDVTFAKKYTGDSDRTRLDGNAEHILEKYLGHDSAYDVLSAFPDGIPRDYSQQYDGLIKHFTGVVDRFKSDAPAEKRLIETYEKVIDDLKGAKYYWENYR